MAAAQSELADFRRGVRAWIAEHAPADPGFLLPQSFLEVGNDEQLDFLREWQYQVWNAGYLGMAWPTEYGGQGVDTVYQLIADEEMTRARVPIMFNVIGLGWAGPLIKDTGTDEEKARYLKNILTGEDIWCQGFSEPEHGSDLGSVQTRAVRDGDDYVINGQKVWTTLGHYADYMILLARTNPAAERKYAGLSFFLAPMRIPGVQARPIRKMTSEYGFTETFFTDARIPADCIMGAENQGWAIAMRTLQYERGAEAGAAGGPIFAPMRVADLIALAEATERDGRPATEDPVIQDQLVALAIEERALHASRHRAHIPALVNERPAALPLSEKLRGTELQRRLRLFAVSLQGAAGGLYVGDHSAVNGGEWQRAYMNNFGATIGGGTSQVQANIVGEMVLGLPK